MKTAAIFSLNLVPQLYLMHRIRDADVIIILTDTKLDHENHVNNFTIRTSTHYFRNLEIPVEAIGMPVDEARVMHQKHWTSQLLRDVKRSYRGLPHVDTAHQFMASAINGVDSPWLTDYLLSSFLKLLDLFGWSNKTVVRGCSQRRRRYSEDANSEYLLDLCLDSDIDQLILGHRQKVRLNQRLFNRNEIQLICHKWIGTPMLISRDSTLDVLARVTPNDIVEELEYEQGRLQATGGLQPSVLPHANGRRKRGDSFGRYWRTA